MATPAARRTPGRCVSKYDQHISQYRCTHGRHHLPGRPYPQHIRVHNGFWNGEALHFAWISARRRTGTPSARRSTRGSRSSSPFWRPCASPPYPSPREDVAPRVERPSLGGPAREIIRRIRGGHEQSAIVSAKCMYSNQRRHRGRMIDIELQVQTGGSGAGDTVYMYDRHILVPRPRFSIIYRGNITEATLLRRRPHLQYIASEPRPRPCA